MSGKEKPTKTLLCSLLFILDDTRGVYSPTQQSTHIHYDPNTYKKTETTNHQATIKTGGTKSKQSQHQMNIPQLQVTW